MIIRIVAVCFLFLSTPAFAETATISTSWAGVTPCASLSRSPAFVIKGFPKVARRVLLTLTQGSYERGGQEVDLPRSGKIPEGAAFTLGPCKPGVYRWTAVFKTAEGAIVGQAYVDRPYP
jgi:hypothetical protein